MCERNIDWLPLAHPQTGDLACNPGMCPSWESNQQPFGLQDSAQSTELHHPGLKQFLMFNNTVCYVVLLLDLRF